MLVQRVQNGIPIRVIFVRLRIVVDNSFFLRRKSVPRPRLVRHRSDELLETTERFLDSILRTDPRASVEIRHH